MQHIVRSQPSGHDDRQAAACELIEHDQHAEGPAVLRALLDEVIRPDVVGSLWPKTDAGPLVQPHTAALGLFAWYFQPFPTPDAIDALDVDPPAGGNEHLANAPVAISAIPRRQPDDGSRQRGFVVRRLEMPSLRRTWLSYDSAGAALRNIEMRAHGLDVRPLPGRA